MNIFSSWWAYTTSSRCDFCAKTWETQTKIEKRRKYCTFDVLSASLIKDSINSCYCFVIHEFRWSLVTLHGREDWHHCAVADNDDYAGSLPWLLNKRHEKVIPVALWLTFRFSFSAFHLNIGSLMDTTRQAINNSTTQHRLERRKWFSRPNPKDWRFNFHSQPKYSREEMKTARTWYGNHYSQLIEREFYVCLRWSISRKRKMRVSDKKSSNWATLLVFFLFFLPEHKTGIIWIFRNR